MRLASEVHVRRSSSVQWFSQKCYTWTSAVFKQGYLFVQATFTRIDGFRGWDAELAESAVMAGAEVLENSAPAHPMHFDSPSHCFDVRPFSDLGLRTRPKACIVSARNIQKYSGALGSRALMHSCHMLFIKVSMPHDILL